MDTASFRYGFRVVGDCTNPRRLVDAGVAFAAHARCDERAELDRECFLSAFQFDDGFRNHLESTGSTKGFGGPCWSPWLRFDIDRDGELQVALENTRRLCVIITERYRVADDDLLVFYSGSKGFHCGLPTAMWCPEPSDIFHRVARRFAENIAESAGVSIDTSIYDRVRCFRAPNSRHPRTGKHKRRLAVDGLMHLSLSAILDLAANPEPFEIPSPTYRSEQAAADWRKAAEQVQRRVEAMKQRRADNDGSATLNQLTLDFIRNGAPRGGPGAKDDTAGRHRRLFSAAANLAEFGCPPGLAYALLTDAGLDSGLPPSDVRRQIDCGLHHKGGEP